MPQNSPKTHIWLKTELIIETGVFFYPIWAEFRPKSSTEWPIQAKFVVFSSFYVFFSSQFWPILKSRIWAKNVFPASWTHLDRSGVPWSYRLLKISVLYVFFMLTYRKDRTFFWTKSHFQVFVRILALSFFFKTGILYGWAIYFTNSSISSL